MRRELKNIPIDSNYSYKTGISINKLKFENIVLEKRLKLISLSPPHSCRDKIERASYIWMFEFCLYKHSKENKMEFLRIKDNDSLRKVLVILNHILPNHVFKRILLTKLYDCCMFPEYLIAIPCYGKRTNSLITRKIKSLSKTIDLEVSKIDNSVTDLV